MNVQDILAIAALGLVGGGTTTKKKKEKKKENMDRCPKCGSRRVQRKKCGKMRCLDCGKVSCCVREVWVEVKDENDENN